MAGTKENKPADESSARQPTQWDGSDRKLTCDAAPVPLAGSVTLAAALLRDTSNPMAWEALSGAVVRIPCLCGLFPPILKSNGPIHPVSQRHTVSTVAGSSRPSDVHAGLQPSQALSLTGTDSHGHSGAGHATPPAR
jgi:hypothetical protein